MIKVSAFSAKAKFKVFCTNASLEISEFRYVHDIVQNSNNPEWKVNYASVISDNDALSQDLVYHKQCITEQWQLLERKLECGGDNLPSSNTSTSGNTDDSVH